MFPAGWSACPRFYEPARALSYDRSFAQGAGGEGRIMSIAFRNGAGAGGRRTAIAPAGPHGLMFISVFPRRFT
jgi:hypothetical protein